MRRVPEFLPFPVADQQCPEWRTRGLAFRVTPDHEVGAVGRLDLYPRRGAPSGLVFAVLSLADDALQAARERRFVQGDTILRRMHELHQRRRQQALSEVASPIAVRRFAQIDARKMQQIEAVE